MRTRTIDAKHVLLFATLSKYRHQGSTESHKTLELKNLSFKLKLLILTVSTNAFHSTNLCCCFSRYQTSTNSVTPSFCIYTKHNPQFFDSLRRRANDRNVSFRVHLRWPIHIINPVDKTKLSCNTYHQLSTTVS